MVEELVKRWDRSTAACETRGHVTGYYVGLDLGQACDHTAMAIVEAAEFQGAWDHYHLYYKRHHELRLRYLERMPLGQPYPEMVDRAVQLIGSNNLSAASRYLAVDATGVGRPVVDLLRKARPACNLAPVVIGGGYSESEVKGYYHVPKRELLIGLQLLLQSGDLRIASAIEEAPAFLKEMSAMRVEVEPEGKERWRSGPHDDLAFAVALACWSAQRFGPAPRPWW